MKDLNKLITKQILEIPVEAWLQETYVCFTANLGAHYRIQITLMSDWPTWSPYFEIRVFGYDSVPIHVYTIEADTDEFKDLDIYFDKLRKYREKVHKGEKRSLYVLLKRK